MGKDLEGRGGYFRWTNSGWRNVLALAEHFGWCPSGTGPPRGIRLAENTPNYYGNDGQRFYARDAANLADALEPAIKEMPPKKPKALTDVDEYEWISSSEGRKSLRRFVKYCREGSFRIH